MIHIVVPRKPRSTSLCGKVVQGRIEEAPGVGVSIMEVMGLLLGCLGCGIQGPGGIK